MAKCRNVAADTYLFNKNFMRLIDLNRYSFVSILQVTTLFSLQTIVN